MKTNLIILTILLSIVNFSFAGEFSRGAAASALSGATYAQSNGWSLMNNQAGIALQEHLWFGVSYQNKFMLKTTSATSFGAIIPTKSGNFGISYSGFGYSKYKENKYAVAFGKKLSDKISMGVQLDYWSIQLPESYGSKGILTGEVGVIAKLTHELSLGVHITNPNRAQISDYNDERLPTTLILSSIYTVSAKVVLAAQVSTFIDNDPSFAFGIDYHISDPLFLRAGISTNPLENSFGFGYQMGKITLDVSASYHSILGYSPALSLSYQLD